MIHFLGNLAISEDRTIPPAEYTIIGPEDQLQEIIIVAYEAALEAGLQPAQALAILEGFAESERARSGLITSS
jgi:hypothetical protein